MVAIPASARPTPLSALQKSLALVDKFGSQTPITQQTLESWRAYVLGMGRIIPCSAASASNVITLTPNDASPALTGYVFGDCFVFWSDAAATGTVTITVTPKVGTLATLKAYVIDAGMADQAGAGDIASGQFCAAFYVPIFDANAGGFLLLGNNRSPIGSAGSFTLDAAATTTVNDAAVTASSKIFLSPTNSAAAGLMGSVKSLHLVPASAVPGVSFDVHTANNAAAAGTETFDYIIIG